MKLCSANFWLVVRLRPIGEQEGQAQWVIQVWAQGRKCLDGQSAMWGSIHITTHFPETYLGKHLMLFLVCSICHFESQHISFFELLGTKNI